MTSSSAKVLEEQLKEAGNKLLMPPSSIHELLGLLDKVENLLSNVGQAPSRSMQDALLPSMGALIDNELLRHSNVDVKISVASCISEITRITVPDAPYNDEIMKEIFRLNVMAFGKLSHVLGRCYSKAIRILHSVAKVKSCLLMLDLECDGLIVEMFQQFLNTIRVNHPHAVFLDMETIMTLVIEESDGISTELLSLLLHSVKKENQNVSPIPWKLGECVLKNCSDKLKTYLPEVMESMNLDPDNYAEVVSSICHPLGKELVKLVSPSATTSSKRGENHLNKASKMKWTPSKEEDSEKARDGKEYGEELVGCRIKVWWPLDQMFYDGAISSFEETENKHKVLYADGDEEMLNLCEEHWQLLGDISPDHEQDADLRSLATLSDKRRKKKEKKKSVKQEHSFSSPKSGGTSADVSNIEAPKLSSRATDGTALEALCVVDKLMDDTTEIGGLDGGQKPTEKPETEETRIIVKHKQDSASHTSSTATDSANGDLENGNMPDSAKAEASEKKIGKKRRRLVKGRELVSHF